MRARLAEAAAVSALAVIITAAIAVPVLRAPSQRVFGMEIVGRHHDPFTVMAQWGRPFSLGGVSQPVTDISGAILARVSGVVAAYNWLVLLSFPLSAAAAYLLARHLTLAPTGAACAAIAYAFSPFHLAQAAYHAHIAQTQWLPLYLLALWRCLDDSSPRAVAALGAATIAVTLSNFYAGMIAAVLTPVAALAYWLMTRRNRPGALRRLGLTAGCLALMGAAEIAAGAYVARAILVHRSDVAFPRSDLFLYSAKWWSFFVPPVAHPVLGGLARRIWEAAGVRAGLLEQQIALGWSVVVLASIGIFGWLVRTKRERSASSISPVPVLVVVALAALLCSLSPERALGSFTFVRPSALLYEIAPMFRSYARFGVVVQLMAALLAGIGLDDLVRAGGRRRRITGLLLVVLAACEYAVSPASLSRDVLPTRAHRWVMQQPTNVRVLDCAPINQESESVGWLSGGRIALGDPGTDCTEPALPQKLAGMGSTHLLVRSATPDGRWLAARAPLEGLRLVADFDDGRVFEVTAGVPAVYTEGRSGFSAREHDAARSWQWMGSDAAWTVVNTTKGPVETMLDVELSSFDHPRRMDVRLDGRSVQTLVVDQPRRVCRLGPLLMAAGRHELLFHPADLPTVARDVIHNGDVRPLSFALGSWTWVVRSQR